MISFKYDVRYAGAFGLEGSPDPGWCPERASSSQASAAFTVRELFPDKEPHSVLEF